MSDYDLMRKSDDYEEDAAEAEDDPVKKTAKDKYFDFYDDIKQTPKDDW